MSKVIISSMYTVESSEDVESFLNLCEKAKKRIVRGGIPYESIEDYERELKNSKNSHRRMKLKNYENSNRSISGSKKPKNLKFNSKDLNAKSEKHVLCKTCSRQNCYNRKPYKGNCSMYLGL